MIYVSQTPPGGWWFGNIPSTGSGWFPANHVTVTPVDLVPKPRTKSVGQLDMDTQAARTAAVAADMGYSPEKKDGLYDELPSLGLYEELPGNGTADTPHRDAMPANANPTSPTADEPG